MPSGRNQISGQGVIGAGDTDVFIADTAVKASSEVIVTPTSPTAEPLAVIDIKEGSGFDVSVMDPEANPVSFTWFLVGTYAADSSTPVEAQQNLVAPSVPAELPPVVSMLMATDETAVDTGSSTPAVATDATATDITDIAVDSTGTASADDTTIVTDTTTTDANAGASMTSTVDTTDTTTTTAVSDAAAAADGASSTVDASDTPQ